MSETPDQKTRRRWITLAEFVAVAGLLIGALTLYLNWSERREDKAAADRAAASEARGKAVVTLAATVEDGGETLSLSDPAHTFSAASVRFPAALGVAQKDAMPGPRIEAAWVRDALLRATDGGADAQTGRLPVLIATSWWDGETQASATARYDLLWRTEGRVLQGRALELTGLVLIDRRANAAQIDAAWRGKAK